MDDRELLELAAKAAGEHVKFFNSAGDPVIGFPAFGPESCLVRIWNPLNDDGDALRLAVKLRISVMHATRHVACDLPNDDYAFEEGVTDGHTRRAIVRAAAEIVRAM